MGKTNFDIVQADDFIDSQGDSITTSAGGAIKGSTGTFSGNVTIAGTLAVTKAITATAGVRGKIIGTHIDTADTVDTNSDATVDPAEFSAVVALLNGCKAKINSLIKE